MSNIKYFIVLFICSIYISRLLAVVVSYAGIRIKVSSYITISRYFLNVRFEADVFLLSADVVCLLLVLLVLLVLSEVVADDDVVFDVVSVVASAATVVSVLVVPDVWLLS